MKKILFCAGVLALAASCTEELDTYSVQQQQKEGITFSATEIQSAATKGEFVDVNGDGVSFDPYWYGDVNNTNSDRIRIYSTNTTATGTNVGGGSNNDDWSANDYGAVYKATKTARFGEFTAINDGNILTFDADAKKGKLSQFVAIYPQDLDQTSTPVAPVVNPLNGIATWTFNFGDGSTDFLANQDQKNVKGAGVYEKGVKYSVTTGKPSEAIQGVGENVSLNFERVLAGLVFKTKNWNKDYGFGDLKYVDVFSKGEPQEDGSYDTAKKNNITLGKGATLALAVLADNGANGTREIVDYEYEITEGTGATWHNYVTMDNTNGGLEWNDDARAYMVIQPVEREQKSEAIVINYVFENIAFSDTLVTSNDWVAGGFYNAPVLDIDEKPYLVVKNSYNPNVTVNGLTDTYTLIVNKGKISDVLSEDGDEVVWAEVRTMKEGTGSSPRPVSGLSGNVAVTNITKIICNVDLDDAEYTETLATFANAADIELTEETTIPAMGLLTQAAGLNRLVLPKVTEINENFVYNPLTRQSTALSSLKELDLQSYVFPETAINYLLFNGMETARNSKLEKLNMKAVKDMTAEFDLNRTIAFEGFTALKEVVMGENVIASQKAFKGCTALVKVEGSLDLNSANAVEAFMDAGKNVPAPTPYDAKKVFSAIKITSDEIPADAFNGAKYITNIQKDGKQVVPTYIGKNAFKNAEYLESMDLSKATTIGANAFDGAKKYVGIKGQTRLNVNAATINNRILAGTKVVNVYFTNATRVNGRIFEGCTALTQVEFAKAFTVGNMNNPGTSATTGGWIGTFGDTPDEVDLFIAAGQQYYNRDNANKLSLPYTKSTSDGYVSDGSCAIVFKSIKQR